VIITHEEGKNKEDKGGSKRFLDQDAWGQGEKAFNRQRYGFGDQAALPASGSGSGSGAAYLPDCLNFIWPPSCNITSSLYEKTNTHDHTARKLSQNANTTNKTKVYLHTYI